MRVLRQEIQNIIINFCILFQTKGHKRTILFRKGDVNEDEY